ncbi:MAG: Rne/Rng family ribonuclease [Phycisphaerae bacterium]
MPKEMLINTVEGHECRIAVVEDGVMEELYIERVSSASRVGNIYLGRIANVEPAIQAAFVDFGMGKNGFLHISDVNPQYFPRGRQSPEAVGHKRSHRDRPPIQECLRRGQEVVVQMTKEGIGTKGPTMTTYLSVPGRLLVMMPGMSRLGVSRKVQDEQARQQARQVLHELNPPADMGFILRTAGIDRPKREIQRDLNYLVRLWRAVQRRIKTARPPAEIYQESDLVIRTIRDVYNTDIARVICDSEVIARKVKDFLDMAMPRTKHVIELYTGKEGLFHDMGLESEIEKVFSRRVELKSGGWLAFDQAEALVAIDVNSGRFRDHSDAETTALKINQEAAVEIARQLRLRDLGGVVIMDFIDMREDRNRRAVERVLRDAVKKDRAKTKVLRISALGIVEMTRQRVRPSLKDSLYRRCFTCDGLGLLKSEETLALNVMRNLQRAACHEEISLIELAVTPAVEQHLSNNQRRQIADLEASSGKRIIIRGDATLRGDEVRFTCTNNRGSAVPWEMLLPQAGRKPLATVNIDQLETPEAQPPAAPDEAQAAAEERGGIEAYSTPYDDDFEDRAATTLEEDIAATSQPQPPLRQEAAPVAAEIAHSAPSIQPEQAAAPGQAGPAAPGQGRRRRGRRGGRRHRRKHGGQPPIAQGQATPGQPQPPAGHTQAGQGQKQAQPQAGRPSAPPPHPPTQRHPAAAERPAPAAEPFTQAAPSHPERGPIKTAHEAPAQPPRQPSQAAPTAGPAEPPTAPRHEPAPAPGAEQAPEAGKAASPEGGQPPQGQGQKRRRRGRRGGRRHKRKGQQPSAGGNPPSELGPPDKPDESDSPDFPGDTGSGPETD